ncbi:MAG: nucleotide exchange factor GrpE [Gammaproteobacteria bacterium]
MGKKSTKDQHKDRKPAKKGNSASPQADGRASAAAQTGADSAADLATNLATDSAADAVVKEAGAKPAETETAAAETQKATDKTAAQKAASAQSGAEHSGNSDSENSGKTGDGAGETADGGAAQKTDPLANYDAAALRDLYLRAVADKENALKRAESEIKKARDFALNRFSHGICEVRDCLEAAVAGGEAGEGVSLTLRKLADIMENNGIRPVRPDIGALFDANLHQSFGVETGEPANTIAAVIQCGYTLNGRVVRPAGVKVKKPAETA